MKTIFIKLLAFAVIFVAVDYGFGQIVKKYYLKSNNNPNYGFTKCKDKEVLFFGASEISHSFISNRVTDSTGMSAFNLAEDACGLLYQYPLAQTILSKYKPKAILISSLQLNTRGVQRLDYVSKMYPYYEDNIYVKNLIDDFSPDEWFKLNFKGYTYNSQFFKINNFSDDSPTIKLNGYIPLPVEEASKTDTAPLPQGINSAISKENEVYFKKIIELANKSNVKVYVLIPPKREIVHPDYIKHVYDILKDEKVEIIDLSRDTEFINNPAIYKYKDVVHLNDDGAKKITDRLIKILKEDFNIK